MKDNKLINSLIELSHNNHGQPFTSLIYDKKREKILSTGVNQFGKEPLRHSETDAIFNLQNKEIDLNWRELTLYTTAEPCPMCQSAIIWREIQEVVFCVSRERLFDLGWKMTHMKAQEINKAFIDYNGKVSKIEADTSEIEKLFINWKSNNDH